MRATRVREQPSPTEAEKVKRDLEREKRTLADDMQATFSTQPGQRVFRWLVSGFGEQSGWDGKAVDGMTLAMTMARREGQRELVLLVRDLIMRGESGRLEAEQIESIKTGDTNDE